MYVCMYVRPAPGVSGASWLCNFSCMYVCMYVRPDPGVSGGNARVQNGVSGRYTHAVFELVAHEESMIWTSRSYTFAKEGLL